MSEASSEESRTRYQVIRHDIAQRSLAAGSFSGLTRLPRAEKSLDVVVRYLSTTIDRVSEREKARMGKARARLPVIGGVRLLVQLVQLELSSRVRRA